MPKILFLSMVDYKAWAFGQALETLETRHPGCVEGRVYVSGLLNRDEKGDSQGYSTALPNGCKATA